MRVIRRRKQYRRETELVMEACRLLEADHNLLSVQIVGCDRPNYLAYRRLRRAANTHHLMLVVDRDGAVEIVRANARGEI